MKEAPVYPLLGFLAVALGAFGAHGLEGRLTVDGAAWWQTATFYLLTHAALASALAIAGGAVWPARFMGAGAVIFASTLYAMALGAPHFLGAITPIGGVVMLSGWLLLAWRLRRP